MRAHPGLVVAAAVLQGGCYNYVPLRRAALSPAAYVVVTLTDAGSEQLAPYLGPNVYAVRGRFLSTTDRGLTRSCSLAACRNPARFSSPVIRGSTARTGRRAVCVSVAMTALPLLLSRCR